MEKKVIFLGGTFREYTQYCHERRINKYRNVYVTGPHALMGRCLCEDCAEIVWGVTGRVTPEVHAIVTHYIAMGHHGG